MSLSEITLKILEILKIERTELQISNKELFLKISAVYLLYIFVARWKKIH
jgi:hypothetical protein